MAYRKIEPRVKFSQLEIDEQERVVSALQSVTLRHYLACNAHFNQRDNCYRDGIIESGPSHLCPKVKRAIRQSINIGNFICGQEMFVTR